MIVRVTGGGCQRGEDRVNGVTQRRSGPIWPRMAAPVLAYENLGLVQGGRWLFRGIDIFVGPRDRLALIGRNGAGQTTLLKCLADRTETDEGRRTIQPGVKVVLLEQDPDVTRFATLREFALAGGAPEHEVDAIATQIGI